MVWGYVLDRAIRNIGEFRLFLRLLVHQML